MSILKYIRPLKQKPDLADPSGSLSENASDGYFFGKREGLLKK